MSVFGNNELFDGFEHFEDQSELSSDNYEELKHIKEENLQLKAENEELQKALRIITQPPNIKIRDASRDGPIAQVLLFNNSIARCEKRRIEEFFQFEVLPRRHEGDPPCEPQHSSIRYPRRKASGSRVSRAFTITDSLQFYAGCFCLDQLGESVIETSRAPDHVPDYHRAFLDALDGEEVVEEKEPKKPKRICFNCGEENHQVKDCPIPKNFKAINQRKQQMLGVMSNSPQSGSNRYHAENETGETNPRFADFKPGFISDTLREALGMTDVDLPPYIYQMRLMGYPPGHLEEAKIATSGLSFYSGRNKKTEEDDSDFEGGRVDVNKIVAYPGFNVPADPHIIDHCEKLGALPMDERHSKDVMVSYHQRRNAILKRKAEEKENGTENHKRRKKGHQSKKDDITEVDMETSDDGAPDAVEKKASTNGEGSVRGDQPSVEGDPSSVEGDPPSVEGDQPSAEGDQQHDLLEVEDGEVEDAGSNLEDEEIFEDVDLDEEELQMRRTMLLQKLQLTEEEAQVLVEESNLEDQSLPSNTAPTEQEDDDDVIQSELPLEEVDVGADEDADPGGPPCVESEEADPGGPPCVESEEADPGGPLCMELEEADPGGPPCMELEEADPGGPPCVESEEADPGGPPCVESEVADPGGPPCVESEEADPGGPPCVESEEADPGGPPCVESQCVTVRSEENEESYSGNAEDEANVLREESISVHESPESPGSIKVDVEEEIIEASFDPHDAHNGADSLPPPNESSPIRESPESPPMEEDTATPVLDSSEVASLEEQSAVPIDAEPGVPHRSRFAKGINRFDLYQEETKSRGVFTKLRTLLKNSPRRSGKHP